MQIDIENKNKNKKLKDLKGNIVYMSTKEYGLE